MKYLFPFILVCYGTAYSQNNCDKYTKDYIPKNLNDALSYLNCTCTESEKAEFKKKDESEAILGAVFSVGNEWGLVAGKNSFSKYFYSIGIYNPEDMSDIILRSFHRQLNGKDIDLQAQVKFYKDYWLKIKGQDIKHNKQYRFIRKRDTVTVVFSRRGETKTSYGLAFLPYNTTFDTANCFVNGVILKKRKRGDSRTVTIKVTTTCNCSNSFLGHTQIMAGQKFNYNMTVFNLKRQ